MHFAHCFKKQSGFKETLMNLADSTFIDYEFMLDSNNKRVISFGKQSGKIGCYLGLMAYYNQELQLNDFHEFKQIIEEKEKMINNSKEEIKSSCLPIFASCFSTKKNEDSAFNNLDKLDNLDKIDDLAESINFINNIIFINELPLFDELVYKETINHIKTKPKVLIIGNGTVGNSSAQVLESHNINYTIWKRNDTIKINVDKILDYDILINAISLNGEQPNNFLTLNDINKKNRNLSVIVDISCDLGNPNNTLPIYTAYTTKDKPVVRLDDDPLLDLIAINNLPSLEPLKSSIEFSSILKDYLPELLYFRQTKDINIKAQTIYKSYTKFIQVLNE
jgi:hypothetical protein